MFFFGNLLLHAQCQPTRRAAIIANTPSGDHHRISCANPACRPRNDALQFIGLGDWWQHHVGFEPLIRAMLDDPFAYIGSLGFDLLVRLLMRVPHLPSRLPKGVQNISFGFVAQATHFDSLLPFALHKRLKDGAAGLAVEEATCATALLVDEIASDGDAVKKWMSAVEAVRDKDAVRGETPFTMHSTVYLQLARGFWERTVQNPQNERTAVFAAASEADSSGIDRFACDGFKDSETSQRNYDAGEFRTWGYKKPSEVEGVLISAASTGRRLGLKDLHATPIIFQPPPLQAAFFRLHHHESFVAVLAPTLLPHAVYGIIPHRQAGAPASFMVANELEALGPDNVCAPCDSIKHKNVKRRCYATLTRPSTPMRMVPVVGLLFRCSSPSKADLDKPSSGSVQSMLDRVKARSSFEHARLCRAWDTLDNTHVHDNSTMKYVHQSGLPLWPSSHIHDLVAEAQGFELHSAQTPINLNTGSVSLSQTRDAVCALPLAVVLRGQRQGVDCWAAGGDGRN